MLIRNPADIRPSEITSKDNYLNRRTFMRAGGIAGGLALAGPALAAVVGDEQRAILTGVAKSEFSTDEEPNSYEHVTTYNNYYEFGRWYRRPRKRARRWGGSDARVLWPRAGDVAAPGRPASPSAAP